MQRCAGVSRESAKCCRQALLHEGGSNGASSNECIRKLLMQRKKLHHIGEKTLQDFNRQADRSTTKKVSLASFSPDPHALSRKGLPEYASTQREQVSPDLSRTYYGLPTQA